MEPGTRCDTVYNMYVGKIQEHKEGMCPLCLKAGAGPHGQAQYEWQYTPDVNIEPQAQSQDTYGQKYGRPPSGRPGGIPTPEPPGRGYDGYVAGVKIPQYPASEPPQILPQNLAAHTPIPILLPLHKKRSKESRCLPPNANGRPAAEERPVFEPPTRRVPLDTANGKQGKGRRRTSPKIKREKIKRLVESSESDDEEKLELNDEEYEPPKFRGTQSRGLAQRQPMLAQVKLELQQPPAQQTYPRDRFFSDSTPDGNRSIFRNNFLRNLDDLNKPAEVSQPLGINPLPHLLQQAQEQEALFKAEQIRQTDFIDPRLIQNTRSHYPEDVTYGAATSGGTITNIAYTQAHNNDNTPGYIPPIFGQTYTFVKPSESTVYQPPMFDALANNGIALMDEDLSMFADVDWDLINDNFNDSFIDPALNMQMGVMDIHQPLTCRSSVDSGMDVFGADNLNVEMSVLEMPNLPQKVYGFPGSVLPMPALKALRQRMQRTSDIEMDLKPPMAQDEDEDDPTSPLFPDD